MYTLILVCRTRWDSHLRSRALAGFPTAPVNLIADQMAARLSVAMWTAFRPICEARRTHSVSAPSSAAYCDLIQSSSNSILYPKSGLYTADVYPA